MLPNRYLTSELYGGILRNTSVAFAWQPFKDNYHNHDDNATPHPTRVVLEFLQQGNVTKIEQLARSPNCNPIEHSGDGSGHAITSMDNPPQNFGELCKALLDKWAEIPVERLLRLAASKPWCLAVIITARGRNTRYLPGIHKITPTGRIMQKSRFFFFYQIYHNYHPMTFRYAHGAYFSNINKCHNKFTKIHFKKSAYNI